MQMTPHFMFPALSTSPDLHKPALHWAVLKITLLQYIIFLTIQLIKPFQEVPYDYKAKSQARMQNHKVNHKLAKSQVRMSI